MKRPQGLSTPGNLRGSRQEQKCLTAEPSLAGLPFLGSQEPRGGRVLSLGASCSFSPTVYTFSSKPCKRWSLLAGGCSSCPVGELTPFVST